MTTATNTVIVGVFSDNQKAQQVIRELRNLGFQDDQIGVATRSGQLVGDGRNVIKHHSPLAEGAIIGGTGGAVVGALWGLGIVAGVLPAVGPAIAGGTLAAIAASAATGAAVAGLGGALIDWGLPPDEAHFYEQELREGRTVVTIHTSDRHSEVKDILHQAGAFDFASRNIGTTSPSATVAAATTPNE